MRDNVCIFSKVTHDTSGEERETGYLLEGTYVESIELDGPKLMLTYADPESRIKNNLQIKEYDECTVSFGDPWREDGVSENETFTVLSCSPCNKDAVKINLMAKPVYELKKKAENARCFAQRGIPEILKALASGMKKFNLSAFPVVMDYHNLPGQRPTAMLRQIAD